MTVRELIVKAGQYLKEKGIEDPSREAGLLLSWLLNKDLSHIYAHGDAVVGEDLAQSYFRLVERRGNFEPFAYITGQCEFMSLTFDVDRSVLIPRPETEILAEAAVYALGGSLFRGNTSFYENIRKLPPKPKYKGLDIGTGSGCIAISMLKYVKNLEMTAVDISDAALDIARRNASRNRVEGRIEFVRADFLSENFDMKQKYDIIVSNPPYIPDGAILSLMPSVRDYEPHTALNGGEDGLVFYRALAGKAHLLLEPGGILAVECGYGQSDQIRRIFSEHNLASLVLKDFSGINRVIIAMDKV